MHTEIADWPRLLADVELTDEAALHLVDLIYALGDHVAECCADHIRRHQQRRRQEAAMQQPRRNSDQLQLDLFPVDLLEPF